MGELVSSALERVKDLPLSRYEDRFRILYDHISDIADEFFKKLITAFTQDLQHGEIGKVVLDLSSSLSGVLLTLPFLSALEHMNNNRRVIDELRASLGLEPLNRKPRVLWFTDAIDDSDGFTEGLQETGWLPHTAGSTVRLVTSAPEKGTGKALPADTIFIPTFYTLRLPAFAPPGIHLPSILKAMDIVSREEPTEILVSTPGPIGLLGLLMSRLLKVKCTGIYHHADLSLQVERITGDALLADIAERFTTWFYSMMDLVRVPTQRHKDHLRNQGLAEDRLQIAEGMIDRGRFSFRADARKEVSRR